MVNLALPDDPYVHGVGQVVAPKGEDLQEYAGKVREVMPRLVNFAPLKEKKRDQLPASDPKEQVAISAVLALKLQGFDPIDIADFFGTTYAKIEEILQSPEAQASFEMLFFNLINYNASSLQGRVSSYANRALDTVVDLMEGEKVRQDVKLKAAQDILDRSGLNHETFFASQNDKGRSDDELTITIMSEDDKPQGLSVTITKK
jgi:hypothetical protein